MNNNNIDISYHSGVYTLKTQQILPISLEKAWEFFSSPDNLAKITPAEMGFIITSGTPEQMFAGQIITYKIGILPGINSNWVTEITQVKEKVFFIDEQRFGPYKMWHHEHHFSEVKGGVMMTDLLYYDVGKWLFGRIASMLFVDRRVRSIFTFREKKLKELFPEKGELAATV